MSEPDLKRSRRRKPTGDRALSDRIPPHSAEAEQGVLGCIFLSPDECLGKCVSRKLNGTCFYDLRHRLIYELAVRMYEGREAVDVITVQQKLKDKGQLETVGGISYLNVLHDAVPSAANLEYYASIVVEKSMLRQFIHTCTDSVSRAYEHEGDVEELADSIERDVLAVRNTFVELPVATGHSMAMNAMQTIEDWHNRGIGVRGLTTGLPDLDKLTDGLHEGEMIAIAARPSMGKTSLALNIAEHVACSREEPVGVFSLEMTIDQLGLRWLCSIARVNIRQVREGFLAERDIPMLTNAAGRLSRAPLHVDDTPGLSIMQLRARARRMHQTLGIKLLVIDYIQLLHSTSDRARENRQQEVADISSGIKALAKELNIPVIVLAQLNREIEKRGPGGRPRLSDLRESGTIEQDADVVGLLYRAGKTDAEEYDESDAIPVNLYIAKQRNGPTGDIPLLFIKSHTRFESPAKVSDEDAPINQAAMAYT